jgi:hypothetical protein
MQPLAQEIRSVIARRLELAGPREVLTIASALCCDIAAPVAEPAALAAATTRFQKIDDEQVLDRATGLIWTRANVGKTMPFKDAVAACEQLELGGMKSWRLPTIRELLTLVDYERRDPAINTEFFACESGWYWTSTPWAGSPADCAWGVYFYYGGANYGRHDSYGFVRAVRASQ